jgi:hypothetical protein
VRHNTPRSVPITVLILLIAILYILSPVQTGHLENQRMPRTYPAYLYERVVELDGVQIPVICGALQEHPFLRYVLMKSRTNGNVVVSMISMSISGIDVRIDALWFESNESPILLSSPSTKENSVRLASAYTKTRSKIEVGIKNQTATPCDAVDLLLHRQWNIA